MKKTLFTLSFILITNFLFSQINFGISIGTGYNKEQISFKFTQIENSYYHISYKGGVWINYNIFEKLNFNIEANYFRKNAKVHEYILKYNYFENPVYLGYKINKFRFFAGITNNFSLDELYLTKKLYTTSGLTGFSYQISKKFEIKLFFNRELYTHIAPINNSTASSKFYYQNFMLNLNFQIN